MIKNSIMFNGFWEDARPFEVICLGLKEYKELKDQHPKIFQSIRGKTLPPGGEEWSYY